MLAHETRILADDAARRPTIRRKKGHAEGEGRKDTNERTHTYRFACEPTSRSKAENTEDGGRVRTNVHTHTKTPVSAV